jgi:hypothetical protein
MKKSERRNKKKETKGQRYDKRKKKEDDVQEERRKGMKEAVVWDVAPCNVVETGRRFGDHNPDSGGSNHF